ncbi:MAG TPA: signal recognition particle subunit SRP19/SEC65 family protein [Nitrososphaeraceae archaeon]|jgi:signal recognition particle subunit SRP19|nr:signal recognition particle subunit SRP19/SEC65 family protein [Nitrososphaeraceae archaeon]
MKDYDHFIIWLDYFNKNLSRKKGRRVKRENAIYDPTFSELFEAAVEDGLDVTLDSSNDHAKFPRRSYVRSGYIMIPKNQNKKKMDIISSLSSRIISKRNKIKRTK